LVNGLVLDELFFKKPEVVKKEPGENCQPGSNGICAINFSRKGEIRMRNLIEEVWTALQCQQLQKDAALDAWDGKYREAIIKMIGSYYELGDEGLENSLKKYPIPRWLIYPLEYSAATMKAIGKDETRNLLFMTGGKWSAAAEILQGNYGAAFLTMSGLYYGQFIELMQADIDQIDAMQNKNILYPWDDLSSMMLPPEKIFEEIGTVDRTKVYAW
jgi:hypothetical protein